MRRAALLALLWLAAAPAAAWQAPERLACCVGPVAVAPDGTVLAATAGPVTASVGSGAPQVLDATEGADAPLVASGAGLFAVAWTSPEGARLAVAGPDRVFGPRSRSVLAP